MTNHNTHVKLEYEVSPTVWVHMGQRKSFADDTIKRMAWMRAQKVIIEGQLKEGAARRSQAGSVGGNTHKTGSGSEGGQGDGSQVSRADQSIKTDCSRGRPDEANRMLRRDGRELSSYAGQILLKLCECVNTDSNSCPWIKPQNSRTGDHAKGRQPLNFGV